MYEILNKLPLLITLTEVEKYVGIPKLSVTKWLMNGNPGNFPAQKIGCVWKVNRFKLIKWLEQDHDSLRVTTDEQQTRARELYEKKKAV